MGPSRGMTSSRHPCALLFVGQLAPRTRRARQRSLGDRAGITPGRRSSFIAGAFLAGGGAAASSEERHRERCSFRDRVHGLSVGFGRLGLLRTAEA